MKIFSKKNISLLLSIILLAPILGLEGFSSEVKAKNTITITISDILAKDAVGGKGGRPEPNSVEEIWDLDPQPEDRTGYMGKVYKCDLKNEYDVDGEEFKPGSKNHWKKEFDIVTKDSIGTRLAVSKYKDEIVKIYGESIYEAALKSGKVLEYQENPPRHKIYSKDTRRENGNPSGKWVNCTKDGQRAFAYDNLDFYITMTFEMEADTPPDIPPPPAGEACVPGEKVIASSGSGFGASRTWEKVECKEVEGATDGITEGDIGLWLYKSSSGSISQMKAKNGLYKSPKAKHYEEKPELEKWTTTGTGISPRVKTAPSTYTGILADGLKGSPVEFRHEYVYTNWYKEVFRGSQTYVCFNWTSATYDKYGNQISAPRCTSEGWSPTPIPYVSVLKEADWGKQVHHVKSYIQTLNHQRGESQSFGEGTINKSMEVGVTAKVQDNVKDTDKKYYETLKMDKREYEQRDTQGALEFAEHPLQYSLSSDFMEPVAWYNIQKNGQYRATELDPNLRPKYDGNIIPVQFDTAQKYGNGYTVPIISSDDFYTTTNTGFMFSVPHGSSPEGVVAGEYKDYTGANYRDTIVNAPAKFKSSYYMPIDGNGEMRTNTKYTHNLRIGKIGLSDYTIDFDKSFSFKHYLLGSVFDDTWIAEQHNPVQDVQYQHSIDISQEDGAKIKELSKDRTMLLHDFRATDGKDFYDKVREILGR